MLYDFLMSLFILIVASYVEIKIAIAYAKRLLKRDEHEAQLAAWQTAFAIVEKHGECE